MKYLYIDAKYNDDGSWKAAGAMFTSWKDNNPKYYVLTSNDVEIEINEYIPGQFYKRELPVIKAFIDYHQITPDVLIVDGYIFLKHENGNVSLGLGGHVAKVFVSFKDIIGVAKSKFCRNDEISELIYRGKSKNPLYVQSLNFKKYKTDIESMNGEYRIPEIFKQVDYLTKHDV